MNYKVIFGKSAFKELTALPATEAPKVRNAIAKLSDNLRPEGVKLKGTQEPLWRIRVGNYGVIYLIDDGIKNS